MCAMQIHKNQMCFPEVYKVNDYMLFFCAIYCVGAAANHEWKCEISCI